MTDKKPVLELFLLIIGEVPSDTTSVKGLRREQPVATAKGRQTENEQPVATASPSRALLGLRASVKNHYDDNRCWPQEQKEWLELHEPTGKCTWQEVAGVFAGVSPEVSPVRNARALRVKTKALRAARAALEADSFLLVEES